MTPSAPPVVVDLSREQVKLGIADGAMLLVDVREPHEFAAGHVPGSVSMPLSAFDPEALAEETGRRVVLSCAAGIRSARALEYLQAHGIDLREHYAGGFKDWVEAGEPVERGS
jgi:rhodanese-related sulfurtransferase